MFKNIVLFVFLGFTANIAKADIHSDLLETKKLCDEMTRIMGSQTPECEQLLLKLANEVINNANLPQVEELKLYASTSMLDAIEKKQQVWGDSCPSQGAQIEKVVERIEKVEPRVRKRDKLKGFFKKCFGKA